MGLVNSDYYININIKDKYKKIKFFCAPKTYSEATQKMNKNLNGANFLLIHVQYDIGLNTVSIGDYLYKGVWDLSVLTPLKGKYRGHIIN